jgi:protein MpaA
VSDYDDLQRRWKALRSRGDLSVREVACEGAPRTLLCVELGHTSLPAIALAAGVHGDEPAGPWALLELAESNAFPQQFSYRIWPCMNPTGFSRHSREGDDGTDINRTFGRGGTSPEAHAIVVANRDRKFVLSIDLHEDDEARGFYCYEYGVPGLAAAAIAAVRGGAWPIQPLGDGIVRPHPAEEAEALGGLSYTLAIARRAAARALTFETPAAAALSERVAMHRAAVSAAIAGLREPSRATVLRFRSIGARMIRHARSR